MMSEVPLQAPMVAPPPSESNSRSESRKRERSRSRDRKDKSSKHRHRSRSRSKDRERRKSNRPRSPSPVKWPRRKSLWDKVPTGFDTGPSEDLPQALTAQQTRQARRIYVGNIPLSVSDIELAEFFNTCLYGAKVTKDQNPSPVTAVQMNREKNFAFLEFTCVEDANAAMGFDGINLQGHSLKIRRPKDFKQGMEGDITQDPVAASKLSNIISTNVEEGPNKIFAGGLPSYLTEEQVKELVSAFGQLKSFNLVKDSQTGISKGFAFFEYADDDVTDKACAGLNGMKLGEKTILVQRANIGAKHVQPVHVTESCLVNKTAFNFLNLQMPIAAAAALLQIDITDPGSPTSVMQLINVVSAPLLESETDFQDILEDIRDECAKYGEIQSMYIPRPPKRHRDVDGNYIPLKEPMWGVGRVFVEYHKPEEAWKAVQALGGRRFSGHIIMAGFFPEDRYIRRDFLPEKEEELKYFEDFKKRQQERLLKQEMEQEALDEDYEYQRRSASRERSREREAKKNEEQKK